MGGIGDQEVKTINLAHAKKSIRFSCFYIHFNSWL